MKVIVPKIYFKKEFKEKLRKNCLKRIKPKKNHVPNVKSELKNWMRKREYVKVVKRNMNKGVFIGCFFTCTL